MMQVHHVEVTSVFFCLFLNFPNNVSVPIYILTAVDGEDIVGHRPD